jgi:hypothetical protein
MNVSSKSSPSKSRQSGPSEKGPGGWTFLTNHAAVLLHIAGQPDETMRSIAASLGLTERTTAAVIADLREGGYLTVERRAQRNHYQVNESKPLRRKGYRAARVRDLVGSLAELGEEDPRRRARRSAGRRAPKPK